ncbi:MAG: FHA domain-containing protein [Verrucomicrobia bacterium]|nr:FHA domain-containing protein [Verrucomicrobiota bacterium]
MNAELILHVEGQTPRTLGVGPVFSIGRGPSNDLVINDTRASRNHAVIRLQGDKAYYLVDLGSSNGTILNGRRVTIPSGLKSGDEIQIANHRLLFQHAAAAPETAQSDGHPEEMRTQVEFTSETVSILVVDIRNYTGLSEAIPAEDLSKIVGKWFQEVGLIIERHNGSIDKFIGDAVMAFWLKAHTEGDNNYVMGPLRSAVEMVNLSNDFHKQLSSRYPNFGFRVVCAINAGRAILGSMGADQRRDFTAVGDCVNVAFRIESLCKELQRFIIVSDEVKNAAGNEFEFEDLGFQRVKGKSQDVRVFAIKI